MNEINNNEKYIIKLKIIKCIYDNLINLNKQLLDTSIL